MTVRVVGKIVKFAIFHDLNIVAHAQEVHRSEFILTSS